MGRRLGWWGGCDLVEFVFSNTCRGAEGSLLTPLALACLRTLRKFPARRLRFPRLQIESPLGGLLCYAANLDLLLGGLKAEHLHFHRVRTGCKIGHLVRAGFIRSGHESMGALSDGDGGSRQWLAAEFHDAGVIDASLRAHKRVERHAKNE